MLAAKVVPEATVAKSASNRTETACSRIAEEPEPVADKRGLPVHRLVLAAHRPVPVEHRPDEDSSRRDNRMDSHNPNGNNAGAITDGHHTGKDHFGLRSLPSSPRDAHWTHCAA